MGSERQIITRGVAIGGGAPITVQSMCNTDTRNTNATIAQIKRLCDAGCDIVRVAVPDEKAAHAIRDITDAIDIPLVADIHFDYRLAILAAENGASKLRINPGNIGGRANVEKLVDAAKAHHVPIRVGVNLGSLEKELLKKYGPTPEAMVESAISHLKMLWDLGFYDAMASLKASDVKTTIEANRMMAEKTDVPLHIGVTEAGVPSLGAVKSAIGIGSLLLDGIGDTIRVSLTGDPVREVEAGLSILRACGIRRDFAEVISCPTCGRTEIDLIPIAEEVAKRARSIKAPIKIAVMGCVVNGPGEARHADVGIAGGRDSAVLFRKGEIIRTLRGDEIIDSLMAEAEKAALEFKENEHYAGEDKRNI